MTPSKDGANADTSRSDQCKPEDMCTRDPVTGLVHLQLKSREADCKFRTILAIDGGGMRGLIPGERRGRIFCLHRSCPLHDVRPFIFAACVLEEVEKAIQQRSWDCKDRPEFQARFKALPRDCKGPDDIKVDLADFFDVVAGEVLQQ